MLKNSPLFRKINSLEVFITSMIEEKYKELREFLIPFVMDRYRSPTVNEEFRKIIEDIAKSFLWCILSVSGRLHLQAIATISIAEATYERGMYNLLGTLSIGSRNLGVEELIPLLPGELHNWLLFLQNNGKLVGNYNRFTGIYNSN